MSADNDSDIPMDVEEPGLQPPKAATLKRKSASHDTSRAASATEEILSDDLAETPQPKKSKSAAASKSVKNGPKDGPSNSESTSKSKKNPKNAVVAAQKAQLEKQNADLKELLAAKEAEVLRLQNVNTQVQQEANSKTQLIPRPHGEQSKKGWNLQTHMGLQDDYETYSNIRRCVRYAVYESQLDIWLKINQQNPMTVFTCCAVVKQRYPMMAQFEGSWAMREFIKGICQRARRHCRMKGIKDPHLPLELLDDESGGANKTKGSKKAKAAGKKSQATKGKGKANAAQVGEEEDIDGEDEEEGGADGENGEVRDSSDSADESGEAAGLDDDEDDE